MPMGALIPEEMDWHGHWCPAAVWRVISSNFIPCRGNQHQNLQISVYWCVVFGRMEQCRSHHHMWKGCARLSNALSDAGALPECRHRQCVGGFFGRERTAWHELFLPIPSPSVLHFKGVACCGSWHGSTHHPLPHALPLVSCFCAPFFMRNWQIVSKLICYICIICNSCIYLVSCLHTWFSCNFY